MIVDSDTILEPDVAEKMISKLSGDPRTVMATGLVLLWRPDRQGWWARIIAGAFRDVGGLILSLGLRVVESLGGRLGGASGAVMMVDKSVFAKMGGLPHDRLADDTVFMWRLQLMGYRVAIIPNAVSYTVDPGSIRGIVKKTLRVSTGLAEGSLELIPKALRRKQIDLALTITYNAFGGLPLILALFHLALTMVFLSTGIYAATAVFKLAFLIPYTPMALLMLSLLENPLAYLVMVYLFTLAESLFALLLLAIVYRKGEDKLYRRIMSSMKYTAVFPLVLWVSSIVVLLSLLRVAYRRATGNTMSRW